MGYAPTPMYVTTDAVAFRCTPGSQLEVLLIERGNEPYKGFWALPGGFVEPDEDLPDACARELEEETGVRPVAMAQVGAWGTPGRDPRGRNVCVAYLAVVPPERDGARGADDAARADWFAVDELPQLGFDHRDIIDAARDRLRSLTRSTQLLFAFLPDRFGVNDVQHVRERVHGGQRAGGSAQGLIARAPDVGEDADGALSFSGQDYLRPLAGIA